ncbi:RlpA-like double-psi beta-barrel-protein domain-containing protein-containing protein, partial [Apiosordaria backusii]
SVGLGACGQLHQDSELVAAISYAVFDPQTPGGNPNNNPLCGRRIRASFESKSVEVTVVDRCPGCSAGSLDLSPAAFQKLADLGRGRIQADPAPPPLTYLFSVNLTFAEPISIGAVPYGTRDLLTISGGTAVGPKISGKTSSPAQPRY